MKSYRELEVYQESKQLAMNLASPWMIRKRSKASRNALLIMGITSVVAGALSLLYDKD